MIDHSAALASRDRLAAIAAYDLDDPELERRLDEVAARTAAALEQPVGLVTLVLSSAQLIAGSTPLSGWLSEVDGTPVEWSFCANAVVSRAPYVVPDAANDPLQHDNPLVTADRFGAYAGVPVTTPEGHVIGAHCVIGFSAHDFTAEEIAVLEEGAAEVAGILEEHRLAR